MVHHALFFSGPAGAVVGEGDIVPGLAAACSVAAIGQGGARRAAGRGGAIGAADEAWGGLGGWVPGMTPRFFPTASRSRCRQHSNLVVQLHLHPSGKAEQRARASSRSTSRRRRRRSRSAGIQVPPMFGFAMGIDIPPGENRYIIKDSFVLPVDVEAYGARGHAHYLAREMKMTATLPDGTTKGLLWIKDWDFGWQDSYFYKDAVHAAEGHAHRHRDHVRQLGSQSAQSEHAAQARAVGPRIVRRDGQHDVAHRRTGRRRQRDAARSRRPSTSASSSARAARGR